MTRLNVDWTCFDSRVCVADDWDDGHVPELCAESCPNATLVWRPLSFHASPIVHVVDDALPSSLVKAIYNYTVNQDRPSWGTYVPIERLITSKDDKSADIDSSLLRWEESSTKEIGSSSVPTTIEDIGRNGDGEDLDSLAARACAWYLSHALQQKEFRQLCCSKHSICKEFHGIAVWALCSHVNSSVTYHVDYAEQVRYQHNLVVLPHLAGTLQCTPLNSMNGGALQLYSSLEHYERHGYKACKEPIPDADDDELLQSIGYRFNRLIVMAGHLPHASTPVAGLPPGYKRVILGFNVFGHDIGTWVQAAPEHSAAWRRQVKLLKLQRQHQLQPKPLSVDSIKTMSPALRKLLVIAKRKKVQEEWRQQYLHNQMQELLDARNASLSPLSMTQTEIVQRLLSQTSSLSTSSWPTERDILQFLQEQYPANESKLYSVL